MVEVQDKSVGSMATYRNSDSAAQRSTGSVPVVPPGLLAAHVVSSPSNLWFDVTSVLLIVVIPTVFWCAVVSGARWLLGWDTSMLALSCVGIVIAGFLVIVRASLAMDRSA
jgi:hypothetical protein